MLHRGWDALRTEECRRMRDFAKELLGMGLKGLYSWIESKSKSTPLVSRDSPHGPPFWGDITRAGQIDVRH